jgi:outer membrane usher protein
VKKGLFFLLVAFSAEIFAVDIEISVPFFVNTELAGNMPIVLDVENELVSLQDHPFKERLYDYLTDKGMEKLDDFIALLGYVSENTPKGDENFTIYFSTEDQSLHLGANLLLLRKRYLNVTRPRVYGLASGGEKVLPKDFSGYINLEGGIRDRRSLFATVRPQGISSFGNFNCNIHYKDVLLNGYGYFLSDNTLGMNPVNGVLTKEFRSSGTKCSLGTINSIGISFQGSSPLLGFNLRKSSELVTDATLGAMSRHDIFLNAPSEVRVIVNGIDVNRLDLPAGSHRLQNFPLAQGLNNVMLKIRGPTGEEREVDISMFYNPSIMPTGAIETNISVGIPYYNIAKGAGGFYDYTAPIAVSGYLKGGLTQFFTLAGYLQLMKQDYFAGLQGIFVKPYFKTIAELGLSTDLSNDVNFKTRVAILQPDAWKYPLSWNLSVEASEAGFRYFGGADVTENMEYLISASLGTYAYKSLSVNMIGQYGRFRDVGNKYSVQSTISVRPRSWLSIRGMLRWEESTSDPGKFETAINLDIAPKYKDFGTKVFYNTQQKALMAAVTFNKALSGRKNISGNLGFNSAPGSNQIEGRIHYDGAYATLNASQQLMKGSAEVVKSTVAVTNANLGTSLVFAGKNFAISRPLHESFVIIAPNKFLRKSPVVVNPGGEDYLAKASYLLPSVIPMQSYSSIDLSLMQANGNYGGAFEDTSYNVASLNHSGAVIEVGGQPKLIIEGTLFDKGAEVEGVTGMLISNFEEDGKSYTYNFFTDSEGVFQIVGVVPGSYHIKFISKIYYGIENIEVEAEDEDFNFVYLGEYFMERKPIIKKHKEIRNE